jgi:hypothetical protein
LAAQKARVAFEARHKAVKLLATLRRMETPEDTRHFGNLVELGETALVVEPLAEHPFHPGDLLEVSFFLPRVPDRCEVTVVVQQQQAGGRLRLDVVQPVGSTGAHLARFITRKLEETEAEPAPAEPQAEAAKPRERAEDGTDLLFVRPFLFRRVV